MKVLILAVLVFGSTYGLGSGPYLPSGWRPTGPAFYLPTETEKPAAVPLQDVQAQQETETSGSSFLREYGPPKAEVTETATKAEEEVSQDLTVQALPDPITEQAFVVIEAKFNEEEKSAGVSQEAAVEEVKSVAQTATATELNAEEQTSTQSAAIIEGKSLDIETQTESSLAIEEETTEKLAEVVEEKSVETEVKQESENANVIAAIEKTEEVEVKAVEEGVNNIAEALVNLENEIKAQQVQTIEEVTELRTIQGTSGSAQQAPEGFLEYGPPGFTEYGPPKGDLMTAGVEEKSPEASFETNETRRRRFSPKFKKPQRKH